MASEWFYREIEINLIAGDIPIACSINAPRQWVR